MEEDLTDFVIEQVFSNLDDGSVNLFGLVPTAHTVTTQSRVQSPEGESVKPL
jgi:hypothetical protein